MNCTVGFASLGAIIGLITFLVLFYFTLPRVIKEG